MTSRSRQIMGLQGVAHLHDKCHRLGLLGVSTLLMIACGNDDRREPQPLPGKPGDTIEIDGGRIESGFQSGVLRKTIEVAAFTVSRYPVTIGEFRRCVQTGVCDAPPEDACIDWPGKTVVERPNYDLEGVRDDVAVTCVGLAQARQYCGWVGGRLPTLAEWFAAARGSSPRRYAWGNEPPRCDQHGLANFADGERCSRDRVDIGRVALHLPGAGDTGVEDALLTRGELVAPTEDAALSACRVGTGGEGTTRACMVYGSKLGAIESVSRIVLEEGTPAAVAIPYGFRCAW